MYKILTPSNTIKTFPQKAVVACQGVEGAYSQIACDKIFRNAKKKYYQTFEEVFQAIEREECRYGVLPIENSTAGSVNKVYDLLAKYSCYIVRGLKLKIEHNLLVVHGTKREDIKEIISHEQAISQCDDYLKSFKDITITVYENTAMAARKVADLKRNDLAALSSINCAELYNLEVLEEAVQDNNNNYTRFICISKKCEFYSGANRTSLMLILSHVPGALYKMLGCLYKYNVNLAKLESRPIKDRPDEYMFYFDIETGIEKQDYVSMLKEMEQLSQSMRYLGTYKNL